MPCPFIASVGTPEKEEWFEWGVGLEGGKFVWAKIRRIQNSEFSNLAAIGRAGFARRLCHRNQSRRRKLVAPSRECFGTWTINDH